MAEYIFTIESLTKKHGEKQVLKDIWLSFLPGAKIGVLGENGTGKSTLLRIMAGDDKEFDGKAELTRGYTVGFVPQEPKLNQEKDVLGNVMEGVAKTKALLDRFDEINNKFAEPMSDAQMDKLLAEQAKVQEQIEITDAWNLDRKLEIAMDAMRLPAPDADVTKLSGGERRRVALCKTLLQQPDLLLLDEPTNHLDAESVAWLERFLKEYAGTVVAVTHDRYFLDNAADWILELDRGLGFPFKGNYSSWLEQKQARLILEEKKESARQKTLKRELEWVRSSARARTVKSKSRLAAYDKLASDAQEARDEEFEIYIPPGPKLGDLVMEATNVSKGFGENLLIDDLSFRVPAGAIVGIIGPNGAGKTTFFKMLVGQEKPDSGTIRLGDTVKLGYVDQNRDELRADKNVWEEISMGLEFFDFPGKRVNTRAYVAQFGFKGSDQQKLVGNLSGGERNRVHLARLLRMGLNVLLLDEPTNDLDVDTLRALEESLLNFPGCIMVTSHDRWFLDRIATHILAFEGDSYVHWCEGNFETYERQKHERLGTDADQPHRIKYKKLHA